MITVIGAGLAGCEAALQAASRGVPVTLFDMKPGRKSPAHHSEQLCELVCSNSLKAERLESAAGLLKAEMRLLGSAVLEAADGARVPAGGALAVDREAFAAAVTEKIKSHPLIAFRSEEIEAIPEAGIVVVATGPLTADKLARDIVRHCGEALSFYDAAAPIVAAESLDRARVFSAARYGRGGDDYLNCPFAREQYDAFVDALVTAERAPLHAFEQMRVYEGCMPVEVMASRGRDTLRFGPLKPVGLTDPNTGRCPYAVAQLRREDTAGALWNLVGFQTNLKFPEQRRVFRMIPGLERAEFARYGVMHRNTFINAPAVLDPFCRLKTDPRVLFAGQITGVEGYIESAASGILAGIRAAQMALGEVLFTPPDTTMLGGLMRYIREADPQNFQPMGSNMGLLPPLENPVRDKRQRAAALADRAVADLTTALRGGQHP